MARPDVREAFTKKFSVMQFAPLACNRPLYDRIAKNTRVRGFVRFDGSCTCEKCRVTSKYAVKYRHRHEIAGAHHDLVYVKDTGKYGIMTVDHILPWSLGGGNVETNFRVLCDECNNKRGNRLKYWEFLRILRNLDRHLRTSDQGKRRFREYVERHYPEKLETLSYILY